MLARAAEVHAAHGYDWPLILDSYFTNGHVFKGPDYFLLGHADDENDAWIVWWAECDPVRSPAQMLRLFLKLCPHYRSRIGWARQLKGKEFKFYSTERLLRFTHV